MEEVKFRVLKKKYPKKATTFVADQETLVLFLNSPVRENWFKILKLKKSEIDRLNKVIEAYAKMKIKLEKKRRPKTRGEIIKIEDECLKKIFCGKIFKLKNVGGTEAFRLVKRILEKEYTDSAIFDVHMLEKLSVLTGADGTKKRFPTDFIVFDAARKKIVGVEVIIG